MNTLLEAPAHEVETIDLCRHEEATGRKPNGRPWNQGSPMPLWLKARAWTIGFGRDDLMRTHWKKVWRSMRDD